MKKTFILISILFLSCILHAQTIKTKQEKGYFNITELGFFYGNSDIKSLNYGTSSSVNIRSLRTINGVFLNPKFSLGLGIGLDGVDIEEAGFYNTFNLFADARYYLQSAKGGWFFYASLGSALKIEDNFEKGMMLNLGVGRKIMIGSNFAIVPSIGYDQQDFKIGNIKYSNETLAMKLGFLF